MKIVLCCVFVGWLCPCSLADHICKDSPSFYQKHQIDRICEEFPIEIPDGKESTPVHLLTIDKATKSILKDAIPFTAKRLTLQGVKIDFIRDPLSEESNPFKALENTLQVLEIDNSETIFTWDWSVFDDFENLEMLVITNSPVYHLGDKMSKIGKNKLNTIHIMNSNVRWITEKSFENYTNLESLSLKGNDIFTPDHTKFLNNAFPTRNLWFLDLSNNFLGDFRGMTLPEMPQLKELYLNDANLPSLKQEFFENVPFKELDELWLDDNEKMVCSSACWLFEVMKDNVRFWVQARCTDTNNDNKTMWLGEYNNSGTCKSMMF